MRKKCSLVMLLFTGIAVFGQNKVIELSLDEAIETAVRNNIEFKSKQIDQKSNEWKLYSVWNTFLPSINLTGSLLKNNQSEDDRTTKTQFAAPAESPSSTLPDGTGVYDYVAIGQYKYTRPEWNAALGFNLTWTFNAAMIFGAYQTSLDYHRGTLSIEEAKLTLQKNIKQSYYGLIIQKRELEIKEIELKSKRERYNQAQTNFRNGLIPRLLLLRSQVAYETALPQYLEQVNKYNNNLAMFKFLLAIDKDTEIKLEDPFASVKRTIPDRDKLIELFEKNNITLRNLYIAQGMVNNGRNSYIASLTPTFQLAYSASPVFMKDPMKDNWFDDTKNDWKDTSGSLRLSVILPVSDWIPFSQNQVGIIGANYTNQKMNQDIKAFKDVSFIQIDNSISRLERAVSNISSMELSVRVAEEAYKLAQDEFRYGTKELLDVQDTESDLLNFRLMKLYAEFDYINNMLELEHIVNTELKEILR